MKELKFYGLHACLAIWKYRPSDILRVYLDPSNVKILGPLLKWCGEQKKPYRILPPDELERVANSVHHEGVCLVAKEPLSLAWETALSSLPSTNVCLLYLDGVQNPHNLGSILRTAAHFGVPYILGETLPSLSPSACRIAKGAAETVRLVSLKNPFRALEQLKQRGFSLIGTSPRKGKKLYEISLCSCSVFVLGSEHRGLSNKLLPHLTHHIYIPGSGLVESLNVAIAAALCMGEYGRQRKDRFLDSRS